jgi:hypothetical protein
VRLLPPIHPSAFAVGALVASLACASGNSSPPENSIQTRQLNTPGSRPVASNDFTSIDYAPVKGSPLEAMNALMQVYADLKIPVATIDQSSGQIGNQNFRAVSHRLNGHVLSDYLNCGQETMMGDRANLEDVTISVLTTVRRNADSVTVFGTTLQGRATPMGTSTNAVDCQSTGKLEQAIAEKLTTALGTPAPKAN